VHAAWRVSAHRRPLFPLTAMGWSWRGPAGLMAQPLHMLKSAHTVHLNPSPPWISRAHTLQVQVKAGAVGLCRWYSTIMLLCLARRRLSNWKWLAWHRFKKACEQRRQREEGGPVEQAEQSGSG
jgi:hypothetical protein